MVRYGIIGAGEISNKFAQAIGLAKNSKLTAIASRNLETAKEFASKYKTPFAYGDYDELLTSGEIDVVYVGTVNQTHMEIIEKAIKHKIPVICEKPLVTKLAQMEKIVALAKENDVLVMEAMWTRFLPPVLQVKEWVETGRIGQITNIETEFSFKLPELDENSRILSAEYEGGAIYDLGVYCIAFTTFFADTEVTSVKSIAQLYKTGVDMDASALIQFEGDITARMSFGFTTERKNDGYIFGEEGYIYLKDFHKTREVTLFDKFNKQLDRITDPQENGFIYQVEHFSNLFSQGKKQSDIMPLSESLKTNKIYDMIKDNWST